MNRYLIYISYIGTHFKAFTKTKFKGEVKAPTTIGVIEDAIQVLRPKNDINVRTISRTDTGVHALNSAVVVDLERSNGKPYECHYITAKLNDVFEKSPHQVRVNRSEMVPSIFNQHTNAVKSRTYLYRLGIIKRNCNIDYKLEEKYRCYFIYSDEFDIQKLKNTAQMFCGRHDFRTFMSINNDAQERASFAIRSINYIKVERGRALTVHPTEQDDNIEYWNITFNATSYLYRQIRRMIGTLIDAAKGRINQRDVYEMLTIPSHKSFTSKIMVAPPHGLYLANVEFRESQMRFNEHICRNINNTCNSPSENCTSF